MLLNLPFVSSKIETVDFKAFMNKEQPKNVRIGKKTPVLFSFIPLHPGAMIDPVFIGIGAGIILIALIEKGLADTGNVSIAAFLSTFLRISFPIAGIAALWYLVNDLKFLFW
ncbi:hypothetical protein JFV29_14135 [Peribacillus sp. TH16]|uniref:hypothetical protein n=1 Tax=Peribacillus sp. TH16 TaxID=2798482 RepID=UPI0019146536|nr:hypothetical protein [Peribacillus sp. TH16]MBK5482985.1 hypothetical protein [Peribacillus sp. TH16]MBK5483009.1 hypothetical protein [Peribacillus sp. TH16]